jgi:hypothetical protein
MRKWLYMATSVFPIKAGSATDAHLLVWFLCSLNALPYEPASYLHPTSYNIPQLTLKIHKRYEAPHPSSPNLRKLQSGGLLRYAITSRLALPYSHGLPSYWPHTEHILMVCHPIGHTQSIFSWSAILLAIHLRLQQLEAARHAVHHAVRAGPDRQHCHRPRRHLSRTRHHWHQPQLHIGHIIIIISAQLI